ncbi:hypothetical protein [Bacillus sp. V59.32b]|uniref:hypothetical protein n=1 Tax=Bacillus sp. V59.32b TaxID=1758642 RepID=UPI001058AAC9|nr:hypothetical protein [Bacillus sp. V59.32b]
MEQREVPQQKSVLSQQNRPKLQQCNKKWIPQQNQCSLNKSRVPVANLLKRGTNSVPGLKCFLDIRASIR